MPSSRGPLLAVARLRSLPAHGDEEGEGGAGCAVPASLESNLTKMLGTSTKQRATGQRDELGLCLGWAQTGRTQVEPTQKKKYKSF